MKKFTLGYQVLAAVILGILVGLFFGPLCSVFEPIAMSFTMLLQLMVLPYLCFSLIHGIGSLSKGMGKKLFKAGWPFLLIIWLLTYFLMLVVSHLIPKPHESLISLAQKETQSDILHQFILSIVPENLIYDLANNIVPAVAIFGVIIGAALMHLEKKEPMIDFLERVNQVIEKTLDWLAAISPIGAFAHIAHVTGTVRFEDLYKLEFFVVCYIVLCLFLTFWVLPLLVSSLIPMSFKEVLDAYRIVCLLPFVTGLSTFAIPFLNAYLLRLSQKYQSPDESFHKTSQTILPLAYSFSQIGNCVVIFFLLFLSFYYRHPFSVAHEGVLALLSIPLSVGSNANTLSSVNFMVQHLQFPKEAFTLFAETSVITTNFQVLVSVASILSLILLTLHAYYGVLKVRWGALVHRLGMSILIFCVLIFSFQSTVAIGDNYSRLFMYRKISDVIPDPVEATIFTERAASEGVPRISTEPRLEQILESGVLKIGYTTLDLPFAFKNKEDQLAGYDIAYAYQLARDLDCKLEFIPIDYYRLKEDLESGVYDIAMSCILMTEDRLVNLNFSHPYDSDDIVLVVPAAKKNQFLNLLGIENQNGLKISAIGELNHYVSRHFPHATQLEVLSITPELKNWHGDAWMTLGKIGFVWCLSNPDYVTIDYAGAIGKAYLAYPISSSSYQLGSFLNNWLMLKDLSGFQQEMVDYWLRGESIKKQQPRWSILRNVLHVDN